jgi:hypothetical protein
VPFVSDWEILCPVLLTTTIAAICLQRQMTVPRLRHAVASTFDALGWATGFLVLNVLVGVLIVHAVRLFGKTESLYVVSDTSLVGLSLVQGLLMMALTSESASTTPRKTE